MHLVCNYMANWQFLTTLACHSHSSLLQTLLHFAGCLSAVTRVQPTCGLPDQSMASDSHFMVSYNKTTYIPAKRSTFVYMVVASFPGPTAISMEKQ